MINKRKNENSWQNIHCNMQLETILIVPDVNKLTEKIMYVSQIVTFHGLLFNLCNTAVNNGSKRERSTVLMPVTLLMKEF